MGTLQFVTGALMMALVDLFVDGTARPTVPGIAGCALATLLFTRGTLGASQSRL